MFSSSAGIVMIGDRFPVWVSALCGGLILALIVAMTTRSDRQPWGHFVSISTIHIASRDQDQTDELLQKSL